MIDLDKPQQRQAPSPQGMPPQGMSGQGVAIGQNPALGPGSYQGISPLRSNASSPPQQQPGPPQQQQQVPPVVAQFQSEVARLDELNSIVSEQAERLASLKRYLANKRGGGGQYAEAIQQAPQGQEMAGG